MWRVWLIPFGILVLGAGAFLRARSRASRTRSFTHEPVSGQWLAERRSREDPPV
jgi:cytochrome c-type biogenesis protein CcmH/NrfF